MVNPLIHEIESFCRATGMAETTFGRKALGDWRFVKELRGTEERKPRRLWPETERTVRQFIAGYHTQDQAA